MYNCRIPTGGEGGRGVIFHRNKFSGEKIVRGNFCRRKFYSSEKFVPVNFPRKIFSADQNFHGKHFCRVKTNPRKNISTGKIFFAEKLFRGKKKSSGKNCPCKFSAEQIFGGTKFPRGENPVDVSFSRIRTCFLSSACPLLYEARQTIFVEALRGRGFLSKFGRHQLSLYIFQRAQNVRDQNCPQRKCCIRMCLCRYVYR